MGLWAWSLSQMLTPKFWKLVRREGFMQTYLRNHRASRNSHYAGGTHGPIRCAGVDQFGNRYYEDFDTDHRNHRRWVEYSDYFLIIGIGGDRVPPAWHGWLAHTYDDVPTRTGESNFYEPVHQRPHDLLSSGTPNHHVPLGAPENPERMQFIETQRDRKAAPWKPEVLEGQFQGKRVVKQSSQRYEDLMVNKE